MFWSGLVGCQVSSFLASSRSLFAKCLSTHWYSLVASHHPLRHHPLHHPLNRWQLPLLGLNRPYFPQALFGFPRFEPDLRRLKCFVGQLNFVGAPVTSAVLTLALTAQWVYRPSPRDFQWRHRPWLRAAPYETSFQSGRRAFRRKILAIWRANQRIQCDRKPRIFLTFASPCAMMFCRFYGSISNCWLSSRLG